MSKIFKENAEPETKEEVKEMNDEKKIAVPAADEVVIKEESPNKGKKWIKIGIGAGAGLALAALTVIVANRIKSDDEEESSDEDAEETSDDEDEEDEE